MFRYLVDGFILLVTSVAVVIGGPLVIESFGWIVVVIYSIPLAYVPLWIANRHS